MTNLLAPIAKAKFFDNNGRPAAGYKLFSYSAGTTTKRDTYPDENTGSPNTNPIILDFRGEANIWIPPNIAYKFVFSPPSDTDPPTNPIWTVDDIVDSQLVTLWGGVDTGIANAYVLNFTSNFTAYQDGIVIYWLPSNTNTGPSTINVNGLGPVPITNQDGSALYLGQLQANQIALIVYRGAGFSLVAFGLNPTINVQNGSYTFQLSDANNIVLANGLGTGGWTIPSNTIVPFPIGTSIDLITDAGFLKTILLAGGVTLRYFSNVPQPIILGGSATRITKIATDTWQQVTPHIYGFTNASFVGNVTGISGSTAISISAGVQNGLVHLAAAASRFNTSTSTAMTLTGLPSNITPSVNVVATCYGLRDNGVDIQGIATITPAGVIQFQRGSFPPSAFTASGDKGILQGFSLVYPLL